jgi:hypothetical protein
MSVPTNTFTTFSSIGNREDLADVIYNVAPTETPFQATIGKGKATNTLHEWQTDTLAAANPVPQLQGGDFVGDAVTPTARVQNRTTILTKSLVVSDTTNAMNPAGRKRDFVYEITKKTKELRRDMEMLLMGNTAPVVGSVSVAPSLRPLVGFYSTNITDCGTGFVAGTSTAAATDGTLGAFGETQLKNNIASIFTNSGMSPDYAFVSTAHKQAISGFAGPSGTFRTNVAEDQKLNTAVSVYVSDFGSTKIVTDIFQRNRDVHLINSDYWKVCYLRDLNTVDVGKQGDNTKGFVVVEFTLEASNEAASGLIADAT